MNKYQSFQLPKVNQQQSSFPNQQIAQQQLFQISKNQDNIEEQDHFWKELQKMTNRRKRYDKTSISLPKKHESVDIQNTQQKFFRSTQINLSFKQEMVNINNYVVIDERKAFSSSQSYYDQRNAFQQQINRKAKYLFRLRGKKRVNNIKDINECFNNSFYCKQLSPYHH